MKEVTPDSPATAKMRSGRVTGQQRKKGDGRPAHHANDSATGFQNPWQSASLTWQQLSESKFPFEPMEDAHPETKPVTVVKPDFENDLADTAKLHAVWLGHASVLVQLPLAPGANRPVRLLFDPIFSNRASPIGFAGPVRRLPVPCKIEELPTIDFVLTTHNHYDHLDEQTIKEAEKSCCETATYIAPLGNRSWFENLHIPSDRIVEMDWWDDRTIDLSDLMRIANAEGSLRIVATPAQHRSGRGLGDQSATLWAGWVIEQTTPKGRVSMYNAGDTGYRAHPQGEICPAYKEIGEVLGPFDLGLVPIWRGGSLSFFSWVGLRLTPEVTTQASHCTPKDAIALHQDIKARHSLAIHFATFAGSDDEAVWPLDLLRKAREEAGVPGMDEDGGFGYIDVGRTFSVALKADET